MLQLDRVKYPCLPQKEAESLPDKTIMEMEASRGWVPAAQECMIASDVNGGLTTQTGGIIKEHPHTQTEGVLVEVIKSLLQARDRGGQ